MTIKPSDRILERAKERRVRLVRAYLDETGVYPGDGIRESDWLPAILDYLDELVPKLQRREGEATAMAQPTKSAPPYPDWSALLACGDAIEATMGVDNGRPLIRGTRVRVASLLDAVGRGVTDSFAARYSLRPEEFEAVLRQLARYLEETTSERSP